MQGNFTMPRIPVLLLISLSTSFIGCAGNKDTMLPADGRTIERIYEEHFSDIGMNGTLAARRSLNGRSATGCWK